MVRVSKPVALGAALYFLLVTAAAAQALPKSSELPEPSVPIKLQVVIKEYSGSKLVKSMPYAVYLLANDALESKLSIGVRFPWPTGGVVGANAQPQMLTNTQFRYSTDHTAIQCRVKSVSQKQFEVHLIVIRSTTYPFGSTELAKESGAGAVANEPAFGDFNTNVDLQMHDGQTIESVMATDPISGHVIKVDVTLHVVKEQ